MRKVEKIETKCCNCDDVVLAHPLKVKAIADAKIKTDKIDATVLAHLLRADLVPEASAPGERARELRVALRERMFYVRLRTMTKNRIVTVSSNVGSFVECCIGGVPDSEAFSKSYHRSGALRT